MKNGRYQIKDLPRLDLLQAIADYSRDVRSGEPWWSTWAALVAPRRRIEPWETRCGLGRFPAKLLYAWLFTSEGANWVDYGTSVRGCWLTEEGEARLEQEREHLAKRAVVGYMLERMGDT
jgi:hypothetical protein